MYVHLKEREYYENRYDEITVELCRDQEEIMRKVFNEAKEKGFPEVKDKNVDTEQEALRVFNMLHYFQVDMLAGERWEKRTDTIQKWINDDAAKDQRISNARLSSEPKCRHCGIEGLRIIDKDLSHRNGNYDHEEVLFMLDCMACSKRTAVWEDGVMWERMNTHCPKCSTAMTETNKRTKNALTTTYVCPKCQHTYKEKVDLSFKNEEKQPDSYWEEDKARFVINDEEGKKYLEGKHNLEQMAKFAKEAKEREASRDLYEAVAQIQKVNIGQLSGVLKPLIEKSGYIELTFDKPEVGKDVYIGFSCLDGRPDRSEYDSRKQLKKTVDEVLNATNWRLMSEGISYRLGYLSGRVRAYEREEDLLALVKRGGIKKNKQDTITRSEANAYTLKDKSGREIHL